MISRKPTQIPIFVRPRFRLPEISVRLRPQHLIWQVLDRRGRVVQEGETHNLILDRAYNDGIAAFGFLGITSVAVVGTGSTTPAATDTLMAAEVARTNTIPSGESDSYTRVADGDYEITRVRQFTAAQVGGQNLTEFGWSGSSTANDPVEVRELFRDAGGTPITVSPGVDQELRLIYKMAVSFRPVVAQSVAIPITNLGTINAQFVLNPTKTIGEGNGWADLWLLDNIAKGSFNHVNSYDDIYFFAGDAPPVASYGDTGEVSGNFWSVMPSVAAYTSGDRKRTMNTITMQTGDALFTHKVWGIGNNRYQYKQMQYRIVLDAASQFTKDNLHKLIFPAWDILTW